MKNLHVHLVFGLMVAIGVPLAFVYITLRYFLYIVWVRYWQYINLAGLIDVMREGYYSRVYGHNDDNQNDIYEQQGGN